MKGYHKIMTPGFTLLDLTIALAIAALLAALAWPSYMDTVRRQRRMDALDALLRLQSAQLRYRRDHGRYADSLVDLGWTDPALSPAGHYLLRLEPRGADGYLAVASPRSGSSQTADACRLIALDENGPAPGRSSHPSCWLR